MQKKELIQFWLKSAEDDLKVCVSLFEEQHFDLCLFIGHLVLEKVLKAFWLNEHFPNPQPRIHNLAKLAEQAPLALTDTQKIFLLKVNEFYLQARYPEEKQEFSRICTAEFANETFKK